MRIVVIGAFGQLGSDLMPILGDCATGIGHAKSGEDGIEITDAANIDKVLAIHRPTHVINCAAYNLVDAAESDPDAAFRVNAIGPQNLAEWCADHRVILMHVSTDYVFGADLTRSTPLDEQAPTGPVSVYGKSKLQGEEAVRALCPHHLIVRTCGLYGHRAARGKGNFVETMLRLGAERPELKIVSDQRCTPTATADLAVAMRDLIRLTDFDSNPHSGSKDLFGTYHATNAGDCSWYEFACEIFRLSGLQSVKAVPIRAIEYGSKAKRPDYSVLDCSKLECVIGREMPSWKMALSRYLASR